MAEKAQIIQILPKTERETLERICQSRLTPLKQLQHKLKIKNKTKKA